MSETPLNKPNSDYIKTDESMLPSDNLKSQQIEDAHQKAPSNNGSKNNLPSNTAQNVNTPQKPLPVQLPAQQSMQQPIQQNEPSTFNPLKPPVVIFRNVTKIFNPGTAQEYCAIKNISFEIEDIPDVGEFIALVGPSGCGKSTVLNLIQGFQEIGPPTTGEVLVRNKPVTGPGKDRGMIFQKYSSFPHMTVFENVVFGLKINNDTNRFSPSQMREMAMNIIKKVGLDGHQNKYPCQLSGGQQQRVAIARTLVLKPRIILMDEPFSALDEPTRIEMQELITNLWQEVEATVFIVTHSLAEAVYLGDRIFIFTPGPGRLKKIIPIKPDDIGKQRGLSPLDVQECPKFKAFLKETTAEFLKDDRIN
ncbi:MAG: ABC transporter ATP-binding protein [Candidatus Riflebacteria bacterium]|nr:ABC transporter ATP-binding protein [Candidatus Riflebacteria bacterium]